MKLLIVFVENLEHTIEIIFKRYYSKFKKKRKIHFLEKHAKMLIFYGKGHKLAFYVWESMCV